MDPKTGRFLSRDPLPGTAGSPASQNGYNYANNNPLRWTDPSGLDPGDRNEHDPGIVDLNPFSDPAAFAAWLRNNFGVDLDGIVNGTATVPDDVRIAALGLTQIVANRQWGKAFEEHIVGFFRKLGYEVTPQVYIRTELGGRYVDLIVHGRNGMPDWALELKTGGPSSYTPIQQAKDIWISQNRPNTRMGVIYGPSVTSGGAGNPVGGTAPRHCPFCSLEP